MLIKDDVLFYLCRSDLLDHGARLDSFIVLFLQLSTNLRRMIFHGWSHLRLTKARTRSMMAEAMTKIDLVLLSEVPNVVAECFSLILDPGIDK